MFFYKRDLHISVLKTRTYPDKGDKYIDNILINISINISRAKFPAVIVKDLGNLLQKQYTPHPLHNYPLLFILDGTDDMT